jgi:hypothetical protein
VSARETVAGVSRTGLLETMRITVNWWARRILSSWKPGIAYTRCIFTSGYKPS